MQHWLCPPDSCLELLILCNWRLGQYIHPNSIQGGFVAAVQY